MINDILLSGKKAKGQRPYFFHDKTVERILNITMAVATELAVTRERLDSLERLLEAKGIVSHNDIECFEPSTEQAEQRQRWHAEYISRILRIVQQEMESLEQPADQNRAISEIMEELKKN